MNQTEEELSKLCEEQKDLKYKLKAIAKRKNVLRTIIRSRKPGYIRVKYKRVKPKREPKNHPLTRKNRTIAEYKAAVKVYNHEYQKKLKARRAQMEI